MCIGTGSGEPGTAGRTTLAAGALMEAVTEEIETYIGVDSARAARSALDNLSLPIQLHPAGTARSGARVT